MKKVLIVLSLFGLLLSGCTLMLPQPKETKQTSALIVWKSPAMKYADMGFILDEGDRLKVEIYSSGTAVMRLSVDEKRVCMSTLECLSKKEFNSRVLTPYYPSDLIENIFRAQPIFAGEGLQRNATGFTQKILHATYEIEYSVDSQTVDFVDSLNNIHIKVTKI